MGDIDSSTSDSSGRRIKVVRLLDEYDLVGLGEELEQRWTTDDDDRMSLRALADLFNRRLLEAAMVEAGMQPLDGEVENIYRLLTADEVSSADRTRIQRRLEREGIAVAELLRDFVTYQAIRTYLIECRDAEYTADERDRPEVEAENLQRLRGRMSTIAESKFEQLKKSGDITLGDFNTLIDIAVYCADCGQQFSAEDLLERRGCGCEPGTEE